MTTLETVAPTALPQDDPSIRIGDITLAISCARNVCLINPDPTYHAFLSGAIARNNKSQIHARLILGKMPDLSGLQKIFDTRESWTLYGDAGEYWISLHPAMYPDPFWIARFDRRASRVVVYCSASHPSAEKNKIDLVNPLCYPLDQLLFMYHLAYRDGVMVHAAGISLSGRGFIFPGCSGVGKSTLARLFADGRIGAALSDERVIVRRTDVGLQVFGTPWAGTEGMAGNGRAPLAGMFFLKQGKSNRLQELSAEQALERLLQVVSIPWYDQEAMSRIILFSKSIVSQIPAYELNFKADASAVDFLVQSLSV
jgi:hypothetical protein